MSLLLLGLLALAAAQPTLGGSFGLPPPNLESLARVGNSSVHFVKVPKTASTSGEAGRL